MQDATRPTTVKTITEEEAKKVTTYDVATKEENGFLVEMFKDDRLTEVYLTVCKPGGFKGYHEHTIRASRYICIRGTMKVILYVDGKRQEHVLTSNPPMRLTIPPHIPTGLECVGDEEGWLVNYPDPPYDPELKDEQIDYTREELENSK